MRRVALALGLALLLLAPASAVAAPGTGCRATHRGLQYRVTFVEQQIRASLGDHFAGAWFDAGGDGNFRVGYTAGADLSAARKLVADCKLDGRILFVGLRWSWRELLSAHESLTGRLVSVGVPERWSSGLTVADGEFVVAVEVAVRGIAAAESKAIDAAVAVTPVRVVRDDVDRRSLAYERFRDSDEAIRGLAGLGRARLGRDFACVTQPDLGFPTLFLFVARRGVVGAARRLAAGLDLEAEVRVTSPRYRRSAMRRILHRARSRLGRAGAELESPHGGWRCPRVLVRPGRRGAALVRRYGADRVVSRDR